MSWSQANPSALRRVDVASMVGNLLHIAEKTDVASQRAAAAAVLNMPGKKPDYQKAEQLAS